MQLTFYGRPNCALCEEGKRIIALVAEDVALDVTYINIEEDDELHEKFLIMIPVVVKGEEIIQYGHIDYLTILDAVSV